MSGRDNVRNQGSFADAEVRSYRRRIGGEVAERVSGAMNTNAPANSPRHSALAFLEGTRLGWGLHDVVTWIDSHLIRTGRLMTRHAYPRVLIREAGVGVLSYGTPSSGESTTGFLEHSLAHDLVARARANVLVKLEGLLLAPPDDSFVQAAIYSGRVSRGAKRRGERGWQVLLTEAHSLSEQVLALFAADLLEHREDYDRDLIVCDTCATVAFWAERVSRRGCPDHPAARLTLRPSRTGSLSR